MEQPIKELEILKALDLRKELEAILYGDLKKEFTALGIADAFIPGAKKGVLIDAAIFALEKLDKATEAIVQEVKDDAVEAVIETVVEKTPLTSALVVPMDEEDEVSDEVIIEKPLYSREVIVKNLNNIGLAVMNAMDSHKIVLVEKQDMLVKMLSDLDKWEALQK
jgi:hypothetical protein